ncbi:MAG: 4-hydroxythreonine-4-phosphate dehydrogenase PdxA, partial [Atribacterota bacterium]
MKQQPILALTMGDPGGVGPEIVVHTIYQWPFSAVLVVIGDRRVLKLAEEVIGVRIDWKPFTEILQGPGPYLIDCSNVDMKSFQWGQMVPSSGQASFDYIQKSIDLQQKGVVDGVVTAPISKEALHQAGIPFIGHTEIFQELTGSLEALTMFQVDTLRVFFLTRHLSLSRAVQEVKKETVTRFLLSMDHYLKRLGLSHAIVAVAALNPHGGEGGLLGMEEKEEISPAIQELCERGMKVSGPFPADSVFWFAHEGRFDAVLSLYHDQGHIATKGIDFYGTVSVTLGLPFIRTS